MALTTETLVAEYREAAKLHRDLTAQLQQASLEKSALYNLLDARGESKRALEAAPQPQEEPIVALTREETKQRDAVLASLPARGVNFTIDDLQSTLGDKVPRKSIAFYLRIFTEDEVIAVIVVGKGKRKGVYRRL